MIRIEDLQFNGLKIVTAESVPSFTTDSVLLSAFASSIKKSDKVADLCSGLGVISLLVHGRTGANVVAFEIHNELCELFNKSIEINGLGDKISCENMDIKDAYRYYNGAFDAVVCNPPYFKSGSGLKSSNTLRSDARSDELCGIDDAARCAMRLLKTGGRFFVCYPAVETVTLLTTLRNCNLEPKRIRFVSSTPDKRPYLVLTEAVKGGGVGVIIENELTIHEKNGDYSKEAKAIYHIED